MTKLAHIDACRGLSARPLHPFGSPAETKTPIRLQTLLCAVVGLFPIGEGECACGRIPPSPLIPVSYTHLTLPTNREV